jgi:hypothetical protein
MNTIPTRLLIVLGLSLCWGMLVALFAWSLTPDEDMPEQYGRVGITYREAVSMFAIGWGLPTAALLATWWTFREPIETFLAGVAA